MYVLWRKVFPEKRCPAQERFYFYFNIFLAPREVGASIILPVFGSAVVALTCMSNIYRKERQDHAMDLKTLAPWSEEFASRSGKFNRNIMGNVIFEQVMAPLTVQTSVLYQVNLNYSDMCLVKGRIRTNTVVKSANLLYEVNISCYQCEFGKLHESLSFWSAFTSASLTRWILTLHYFCSELTIYVWHFELKRNSSENVLPSGRRSTNVKFVPHV